MVPVAKNQRIHVLKSFNNIDLDNDNVNASTLLSSDQQCESPKDAQHHNDKHERSYTAKRVTIDTFTL